MDSASNLTEAMNSTTLDEEKEAVLAIQEEQGLGNDQQLNDSNAKLCVVARFISDGRLDFPTMQKTLVALQNPCMGVYIKEPESNLFILQFYHEVDVKRVGRLPLVF